MTFKADTIEEFKILQFIKQHFDMSYITIEKISRDCLQVTDQKGDSIPFEWDNQRHKVVW